MHEYDSHSRRLSSSSQQQWDGSSWFSLSSDFVEKGLTYDRNGNLLTLQRTSGGVPVDDLSYTYTGNRLTGLEERVRTSPSGDVYRPGDAPSGTYAYDANGNLQKDTRKGLTFKSNRLNLLGEVYAGDTLKARYTYLSDGTKLCVRDGSGRNGYDYLGSFVYKVSEGRIALDRVLADGVQLTSSGVRYALTDHLGSVRALVDESGRVVRQTDYYPFGAQVSRPSYAVDSSRFLFSGKESQELLDLNAYDFGARMYDASLCRWQSVDPMCEKYADLSPYNYCVNNPLVYVDPNGEDAMITIMGNVITISLNVILFGEAADMSLATMYELFLYSRWGNMNTFTYDGIQYDVQWNINVSYDSRLTKESKEGFDFDGMNNYMEVLYKETDEERSEVNNSHWGIIYRNRDERADCPSKYSMAHEFGHLLGLKDRYNSSGAATSEKYEGNIMHKVDGVVNDLNMQGILNRPLFDNASYEKDRRAQRFFLNRSFKPVQGIFHINYKNREKK